MKKFTQTGVHWTCQTQESDDEDDLDYPKKQNTSKINKTCFVIEPSSLLGKFHRKTHFEASNSLAHGVGTMKVRNRLLNMQFIEIQQNLQQKPKTTENHQADDEDARLVRELKIKNSVPDYEGLSR